MAESFHTTLFHARLVRERVAAVPAELFAKHRAGIEVWAEHLRSGALEETKEVSLLWDTAPPRMPGTRPIR